MSALPGGAADRLGNRYEDWWTLWRLADLLQGRATRIRVEPPGVGGTGAEFWIDDADGRWFEQVKNETRNWTIQRLLTGGVLTSLLRHLQDGHRVRLVTSSAARGLADLSARARVAADLPEYEEILNRAQRRDFERLAKGWGVAADQAWELVSRVYVELRPVQLLRDAVHLRCFTDELRHETERNVGHLDWTGITGSLIGHMSEGEQLTAPQAVLDGASRAEVAALVSRGVLTTEADRVGFFHESYFDFLFARAALRHPTGAAHRRRAAHRPATAAGDRSVHRRRPRRGADHLGRLPAHRHHLPQPLPRCRESRSRHDHQRDQHRRARRAERAHHPRPDPHPARRRRARLLRAARHQQRGSEIRACRNSAYIRSAAYAGIDTSAAVAMSLAHGGGSTDSGASVPMKNVRAVRP